MLKIEHIGIAVKNIEQSNELFRKLLNASHYKTEIVESDNSVETENSNGTEENNIPVDDKGLAAENTGKPK